MTLMGLWSFGTMPLRKIGATACLLYCLLASGVHGTFPSIGVNLNPDSFSAALMRQILLLLFLCKFAILMVR